MLVKVRHADIFVGKHMISWPINIQFPKFLEHSRDSLSIRFLEIGLVAITNTPCEYAIMSTGRVALSESFNWLKNPAHIRL